MEVPQVVQGVSPFADLALVPVLPGLRDLVPGGGLRPGSVTSVVGSVTLALALTAGLGDRLCAIVGIPEINVHAAAAMGGEAGGLDPERVLLVDEPGSRWADVVAALTDACALVLVRPPGPPSPQTARRLPTLARRNGCALVVNGPWESAQLRLWVEQNEWFGLGDGHGHLRGRRALVAASGRGSAARGRRLWLWLPGRDGTVTVAAEQATESRAVAG
ncbi:hypothetical protein [Actinoallomurus acanthiterrae]